VLVAAALSLLALYLLVSQYIVYYRDDWLFKKGQRAEGLLYRVETSTTKDQRFFNEPIRDVELRYTVNGKPVVYKGYLTSFDGGWLVVGNTIPLRVDPSDPEHFTARQSPVTLMPHLVAGLSLLPLVAVAVAVAAWRRRRLLHLWKTGELLPAVVIRTSGVAVAPSARAVECTATDSDDKSVRRAYIPSANGATVPGRGDLVWLIVSPDRAGPAIAANWFSSRPA
jgi:hypothetical protein